MYPFNGDSLPVTPKLKTKKALLLIDLQNDFTSTSGKLHVKNTRDFLPRIPGLASKFRETGEVIWVRTEFVEPRPTISAELGSYAIILKSFLESKEDQGNDEFYAEQDFSGNSREPISASFDAEINDPEAFLAPHASTFEARCCLPATVGSEQPQLLTSAIRHDDTILKKSEYSAFNGTSLLSKVRMKLITELYLCGSLSNVSVYATALDAVRHGLAITVIEDCVGFLSADCHEEAMRQMADAMGANGVDCQELIDDLDGFLGDVVIDSEGKINQNLGLLQPEADTSSENLPTRSRTWDWIANLDSASMGSQTHLGNVKTSNDAKRPTGKHGNESSVITPRRSSDTPDSLSPPRKRSTGELDLEERDQVSLHTSSRRRSSYDTAALNENRTKPSRIRLRRRKDPKEQAQDFATDWTPLANRIGAAAPTSMEKFVGNKDSRLNATSPSTTLKVEPPTAGGVMHGTTEQPIDKIEVDSNPSSPITNELSSMLPIAGRVDLSANAVPKWQSKNIIGQVYSIGEGDSHVLYDFMPIDMASHLFDQLKKEVEWRKMLHRGGDVPRLVAVQGEVSEDGSIPIYRHPADETPPLRAFSITVQSIRKHVEKVLQQPVNHVLIQLYRDGSDNISEHSDKTLDVFRGSTIVNYSVGAERVMTLRTKKIAAPLVEMPGAYDLSEAGQRRRSADPSASTQESRRSPKLKQNIAFPSASVSSPELHHRPGSRSISKPTGISRRHLPGVSTNEIQQRSVQRIPLPHNSLFILGHRTNQAWLHGVRPDKRRESEKLTSELAFKGERISLTFRCISTFINPVEGIIWGQGATSKDRSGAKKVLTGTVASNEGEKMIQAFGQQNHQSQGFRWEEYYGAGFDVVDFLNKEPELATG